MAKKLIVNADDFGLTSSITRGVVEGHRSGVITSTSLMASGSAFEEACELASQTPTLDVGVHLILDEENSVLERKQIPTLVGRDGRFHPRTTVIKLLVTKRISLREVEYEWSAQIERCLAAQIRVSHLDSHGHIHCFPGLAGIAEKLRRHYKIGCLRKPRERLSVQGYGAGWRGYIKKTLVSGCAVSSLRPSLLPRDHRVDFFHGLAASGRVDATTLWSLLAGLGNGTNELMVHPGYADAQTKAQYGHWQYHWEDELAAVLVVGKDRAQLDARGIVLTNFAIEYPMGA